MPFAISISSSNDRALITASTGPKISSCAIRADGFTSAMIVGFRKYPGPECLPPPVMSLPSPFPISTYSRIFFSADALATGPR